jgi:hypothetical protein
MFKKLKPNDTCIYLVCHTKRSGNLVIYLCEWHVEASFEAQVCRAVAWNKSDCFQSPRVVDRPIKSLEGNILMEAWMCIKM